MKTEPLTLREVQRMAEVTGCGLEYLISILPGWVQASPEWSAAIVRRFIEWRRGSTCVFDAPVTVLDRGGAWGAEAYAQVISGVKSGKAPIPISIHDNENDCFLRYEDAPVLVPSDEIILDGYEFEPLTLDEAGEYLTKHAGRYHSWQAGSAVWSAALARAMPSLGARTNRAYMVLYKDGTLGRYESNTAVLNSFPAMRGAVSIHDNERDIFVRPSTEPRLVRIDPS